ncbi:MAG: MarR family transcriptional regulator [Thermoleophilaceae bacterium]
MARPTDLIAEARRQWERRWGGAPAAPMAAVTSIMRVEQVLMAELNELLKPFDLTFPRYEALMLLSFSQKGELPLGKVGERLQVHRTSVTNTIDRLEASGYVSRKPHPEDRRTTLAEITPAGRRVAKRSTVVLNDADFALEGLTRAEIQALTRLLREVRAAAGDFD